MDERDGPAVERVRADLARLGRDEASAPDVPPEVTDQVVAALRAAPRSRSPHRAVRVSAAVGAAAVVVAAAVGVVNLVGSDAGPSSPRPGTEPASPTIPLSDSEILALLHTPPDLGLLGDPRRRASCLSGLGYLGSTAVLGGRQLAVLGQPAVLLVLADDTTPDDTGSEMTVVAMAVSPNCSAADTGLLAETQIRRP